MSALRTQFTDTMKTAMKSGDSMTTATIRLIIAALKERDINARGQGREAVEDGEILSMLQGMVKQRQESSGIYRANARPELADKEDAEIKIIEKFLPAQMSEDEVDSAVAKVIADMGATSIKDMGKVMAEVKTKYAGQMDMAKASGVVKSKLAA